MTTQAIELTDAAALPVEQALAPAPNGQIIIQPYTFHDAHKVDSAGARQVSERSGLAFRFDAIPRDLDRGVSTFEEQQARIIDENKAAWSRYSAIRNRRDQALRRMRGARGVLLLAFVVLLVMGFILGAPGTGPINPIVFAPAAVWLVMLAVMQWWYRGAEARFERSDSFRLPVAPPILPTLANDHSARLRLLRSLNWALRDDLHGRVKGWVDLSSAIKETNVIDEGRSRAGAPVARYLEDWFSYKGRLVGGPQLHLVVTDKVKQRLQHTKRGSQSGRPRNKSEQQHIRHKIRAQLRITPGRHTLNQQPDQQHDLPAELELLNKQISEDRIEIVLGTASAISAEELVQVIRHLYSHLRPAQAS
ncbi:MAG: hypothetical protein GYB67_10110 [Chloroflexi bacterium]|nr:hypothetical protein [Chloroflexota bacterium]